MISQQGLHLKAWPTRTLMDETLELTASDLKPGQTLTVIALTVNEEDGAAFYSMGEYQADGDGFLDVNKSFSFGGTYVGVESMGLFWSAVAAPGQKKSLRLIKRIVDKPLLWLIFLVDGSERVDIVEHLVAYVRYANNNTSRTNLYSHEDQMFVLEWEKIPTVCKSVVLACTVVKRYYCYPENIRQIKIRDGRLRGILFVPNRNFEDSNCQKTGIIDIYGGGSFKVHRAALLAERGFVVFALAYCDYEDLSTEIDIDVAYLLEAVNFMFSERCPENIFKEGLGAIGLCKGATLALEMAAHHPGVKAVVAINAPCFNEIGRFRRLDSEENIAHSWDMSSHFLRRNEEGVVSEGLFNWFDQQSPANKQKFGIAVERVSSILFIYGKDDASVGIRNLNYFVERLINANRPNFRCLVYPHTGHIIDPPIFPLCRSSYWPLFRNVFVWGGEARMHHQAQVDSWNHILKYFRSQLSESTI